MRVRSSSCRSFGMGAQQIPHRCLIEEDGCISPTGSLSGLKEPSPIVETAQRLQRQDQCRDQVAGRFGRPYLSQLTLTSSSCLGIVAQSATRCQILPTRAPSVQRFRRRPRTSSCHRRSRSLVYPNPCIATADADLTKQTSANGTAIAAHYEGAPHDRGAIQLVLKGQGLSDVPFLLSLCL